jgi:hypothetical protein
MSIKCAECQCVPEECLNISASQCCPNCTKEICCCTVIHHNFTTSMKLPRMDDDGGGSCSYGVCKNDDDSNTTTSKLRTTTNGKSSIICEFFRHVKSLYAAALGIEILCIAAAEIGENSGLYILGFNHIGIPIAYAMGYGLATFTTFVTILGRYKYGSAGDGDDNIIDSSCCCSVLEQDAAKEFLSNIITTFKNFCLGLRKLKELPKQPNVLEIFKTSLYTLISAETACIITAETVDLIFYKQAIYLSIPLALAAGAFTVVAPQAYRKMKQTSKCLS